MDFSVSSFTVTLHCNIIMQLEWILHSFYEFIAKKLAKVVFMNALKRFICVSDEILRSNQLSETIVFSSYCLNSNFLRVFDGVTENYCVKEHFD